MRLARLYGQLQRFRVHVTLHQEFTAAGVRRDDGNQATIVELGRKVTAFLYLFDRLSRLELNRCDGHRKSSCYVAGPARILSAAPGGNIVIIPGFRRPDTIRP